MYGSVPKTGDRIELHPACDMWMRGARYGDVESVKLVPPAKGSDSLESVYRVTIRLDATGKLYRTIPQLIRIID